MGQAVDQRIDAVNGERTGLGRSFHFLQEDCAVQSLAGHPDSAFIDITVDPE